VLVSINTPGSPSSESSARIPVDVRRFSWIRRLAADYAYDFPRVAPFFAGDPAERRAWSAAIARTQGHRGRRSEIASVVAAQQERRQASPRAVEAAARLTDASTVAILTGQQAGLFGGPLFTLLKAMTALKLAGEIARDHQVPAVAVFWVEGEDHDWDEVRSCTVFDKELVPRTVGLPPRTGDPAPVASVSLDGSITKVIDELAAVLPPTEFTSTLLDDLRGAYAPGHGMADGFARWLERLLGPRGLIVYDASDAASKPLAADVFSRELSTAGQTARLASTAGSDLVSRGYHAQVHVPEDNLALFRLDGARRAIRQQDGQLLVGDERYQASALRQEAIDHPSGFSPGVLLRPIVQDALFPTVCYVAGPNELAYLGQLRGVYEHFGVPMPLMYPRTSATLVDSATLRFLTKYQLPLEALQAHDDAALNALLATQIPPAVEQAFQSAAAAIDTEMMKLTQAVPAIDPTLEGTAKTTLGRMQHDLDTLHNKMIQAAKRRHETLRRQFAHARALTFPHGDAQERAIAFVSFLNQYGPALLDRLGDGLPLDLGHHWILSI
jgi:bacillithiol biosynthesis cysteine-adding enzyme BshC